MITIIVPVYNVQKYVERCLLSIKNQSFTDFECLIVDDGSTDDSLTICKQFEIKDSRFKIISKPNGGLSSARNRGLDNASGEYIYFIDSDDYIHKDSLFLLMSNIGDADIACGNFITFNQDVQIKTKVKKIRAWVLLEDDVYKNALNNRMPYIFAWNKLYRKELFDNLRYEKCLYEDIEIFYKIISKTKKVKCISFPTYYYNVGNTNSITSIKFSLRQMDSVKNARKLCFFIENKYPKLKKYCNKYLVANNFNILKKLINSSDRLYYGKEYLELSEYLLKNKKYFFYREKNILKAIYKYIMSIIIKNKGM